MPWFLGNRIEIYSNHHWRHLSKKTPNCEDHCRLKRRSAALRFELWVSERPWWPVQVPCNFSLVSWHVGVPPPEKLTAILHLKMSQNPKGTSIRNHPFSGAFAVVYEFDACRPRCSECMDYPYERWKMAIWTKGKWLGTQVTMVVAEATTPQLHRFGARVEIPRISVCCPNRQFLTYGHKGKTI